jgi:hypothetical protein
MRIIHNLLNVRSLRQAQGERSKNIVPVRAEPVEAYERSKILSYYTTLNKQLKYNISFIQLYESITINYIIHKNKMYYLKKNK